eukprot:SAG22_NODE_7380_length_745_cov_1.139319_1_plen_96_part_00
MFQYQQRRGSVYWLHPVLSGKRTASTDTVGAAATTMLTDRNRSTAHQAGSNARGVDQATDADTRPDGQGLRAKENTSSEVLSWRLREVDFFLDAL